MRIRDIITDTMGLACVLALTLAPLGLYKDDSGFGWWWPGVGGYHIETSDNQ